MMATVGLFCACGWVLLFISEQKRKLLSHWEAKNLKEELALENNIFQKKLATATKKYILRLPKRTWSIWRERGHGWPPREDVMNIDSIRQVSNFVKPVSTEPANLPQEGSGKIPANDNLKHENVQVTVDVTSVDVADTPSGAKMRLDYLA